MYKNAVPSSGELHRYSAHRNVKPVNFVCVAPKARSVHLIGDFNHWREQPDHPMTQRPDGAWFVEVPLRHGHHRYVFVVDGERQLDPNAQGIARDDKNQRVSLISVS